jgi:23S rRNA (guanosine2251-2'-O)-methyltransferase
LRAGNPLDRILIAQGAGGARLQEIIDLARRASIPVRFEPRASLDRLSGTAAHQGVVAMGAAKKYADLETAAASQLVVLLDGVEDPHNLGAIIRTAHAAGAARLSSRNGVPSGSPTSPRRRRPAHWNTCRWSASPTSIARSKT